MRDDSRRERWRRVEALYHAGLALPAGERAAFLTDACAGDARLRDEVESLLSAAVDAEGFLERRVSAIVEAAAPPRGAAIGSRVGRYEVTALLGSGGMGDVYRARDARLGRDVAVKVLPDRVTQDPSFVERFSREARAVSALNHPNIVTIHEIGETPAARFIVMELVEGRTLREMACDRMALESIAAAGAQIARGLAVAHAAGIVHRDIKPENVMVRPDGYVKLLDFGLAQLAGGQAGPATMPGVPFGTVGYMSPEQARGDAATASTDVFSLGVVLYELATGRRPFVADSEIGVLHAIVSAAPAPPAQINPEVPAALDRLIMRMLCKDARLRPTAADVEASLDGIAAAPRAAVLREAPLETARHVVGREREHAELRRAFASTVSGRGLLVSIAGEPGIGKTTLVDEFLRQVSSTGSCVVARGRCSERLAGAEAYLPWLEVLADLLRGEHADAMTRAMKLLAPTWHHWIAPTGIDTTGGVAARTFVDAPALSPERMTRELVEFVEHAAQVRPLLLFFDDVHWADVSSVDLLAYLGARLDRLPVLIVAAYRHSELLLADHPFLRVRLELQARGICRHIALSFLTPEDVERYLSMEFPGHRFPPGLQAAIHARTEGNALFTVELLRHLREARVIDREDGHWTLAHSVAELPHDLPESVRSMVQRRIGSVSESDSRLLAAASVQGYEFDSATVARALGMPAADVEERLDALDRAHGLVTAVVEHELPDRTPTVRYRFVHVLYQNALFATLRPTRKALLSDAVARSLMASHGSQDAAIASELGILLEAARDFAGAGDYFLLAAQQASRRSANREAAALARRGLDAVLSLPDTPERAARELRLQITLGPALMTSVGWGSPEVEAVYRRARELCREVAESAQLFPVVWGLWQYWLARAEYGIARELGEQLLALAGRIQDPALMLMAHHSLSNTAWQSGEFVHARLHAEEAIAIYVPGTHHALAASYGGHDSGVANRCRLAVNLWLLGYPERAIDRGRDALALARGISHATSIVLALVFDAMVHQHCRDADRARVDAEEAMALARESSLGPWLAWATALRGWSLAEAGRADEGVDDLQRAVAGWIAAGVDGLRPYFLFLLADAYAKAGRRDRALRTLAEALTITQRTREGYAHAELYRLRGELQADPADACRDLQLAIEIAEGQHAQSLRLRAATRLARLHATHGRRDEARRVLAPAYGWFTEGFQTRDLTDARALLGHLVPAP